MKRNKNEIARMRKERKKEKNKIKPDEKCMRHPLLWVRRINFMNLPSLEFWLVVRVLRLLWFFVFSLTLLMFYFFRLYAQQWPLTSAYNTLISWKRLLFPWPFLLWWLLIKKKYKKVCFGRIENWEQRMRLGNNCVWCFALESNQHFLFD